MKTQLASYLRQLGALSVALGCAGAVGTANAAPQDPTRDQNSIDRLVAQAEGPDATSGDFSIFLPWYYRAWPESTWRNYHFHSAQLNRTEHPPAPIESYASLFDEVRNEA